MNRRVDLEKLTVNFFDSRVLLRNFSRDCTTHAAEKMNRSEEKILCNQRSRKFLQKIFPRAFQR
jgi:hypothetical protein